MKQFGRWMNRTLQIPEIETPIGAECSHCGEPIVTGELGVSMPVLACEPEDPAELYYHRECIIRRTVGSVAHLEGRCTCCGGTEHDPPAGMTLREAARAAVELFERRALARQKPDRVSGDDINGDE